MSYLRGPDFYVWSDGEQVHIWASESGNDSTAASDAEYGAVGVKMPIAMFDLMVRERMSREDFKA